jgi:hypothetical protein
MGDHIIFEDCIEWFRRPEAGTWKAGRVPFPPTDGTSYIGLDFNLPTVLDCGPFKIEPTTEVVLWPRHSGFIAPVTLPDWIDKSTGHLFSTALSAVVSFATSRPVTSVRGDYRVASRLPMTSREWS